MELFEALGNTPLWLQQYPGRGRGRGPGGGGHGDQAGVHGLLPLAAPAGPHGGGPGAIHRRPACRGSALHPPGEPHIYNI